MTTLIPMRPEAYDAFVEDCVASYASDNVESHRWAQAGARERARAEFMRLMPQGLQTPGQSVYEIHGDCEVVGFVWFAVQESAGVRNGGRRSSSAGAAIGCTRSRSSRWPSDASP